MVHLVPVLVALVPVLHEEYKRWRDRSGCKDCGAVAPVLPRKTLVKLGWRGTKKMKLICPTCASIEA